MGRHRAKLICADYLDVYESWDLGDVHCIVTDPPYGTGGRNETIIMDSKKKVQDFSEEWDGDFLVDWYIFEDFLVPGGSIFSYAPFQEAGKLIYWFKESGVGFKRPIFLNVKATAVYPSNRKNLASKTETVLFFRKPRTNGSRLIPWHAENTEHNDWTDQKHTVDRRRIHSTQKSVSAFKRMIELTTEPGDTILDPFAGSCVSGIAAILAGRNWIGIEKNLEICMKAWNLLHDEDLAADLKFEVR